MNGDELLLLTPIGPREDVALDLDWILQRLKEPFFVEGFEIFAAAESNRLEQRLRLMIRDRRVCCAQGFCLSRSLFLNSFEAPSTHRHEARLLNPTREISAGRPPQGIAR